MSQKIKNRPPNSKGSVEFQKTTINFFWARVCSDFYLAILPPYMGVIPNPKMAFIFPISIIKVLIFPIFIFMIYIAKCEGKGKRKIKIIGRGGGGDGAY